MEFVNGKHLANYLLKIFKNNGIDVPSEDVGEIKNWMEYLLLYQIS